MKIAIFGGAFDPPHIGHKLVADSLLLSEIVDEVWFVPVFKHPWAQRYGKQELTDYEDRVKMLELTIDGAKRQKVAHYKEVSFTYDTLQYFTEQVPEHEFSWVMGSEYLGRFDDFLKGHPKLLDYRFYIYPRAGYEFKENLKKINMKFLYDMPEVTASSTHIKQLIQNFQPINGLVLQEVADYIESKQLYL